MAGSQTIFAIYMMNISETRFIYYDPYNKLKKTEMKSVNHKYRRLHFALKLEPLKSLH